MRRERAKQHRIAIVVASGPVTRINESRAWQAFWEQLRRLGDVEGENLIVERYSGEGRSEGYGELARQVVSHNPDVIVPISPSIMQAVSAATTTIPIVGSGAYTELGQVPSLARPGGNITGITVDVGWQSGIEALAESPRSPLAHYARGTVLRAQDRFDEAIPEYETVIDFDRDWLDAYANLGQCKLYSGSPEQAIPLLKLAVHLSPRVSPGCRRNEPRAREQATPPEDRRCPARSAEVSSRAHGLKVCGLFAGGKRIRTCMGLFLSSRVFGLLSVLCSERESRSSFRRCDPVRGARRKGVKGPKRQQSLAACRLAALVFRSALTPEHAKR